MSITKNNDPRIELTPENAEGMTLNKRLWHAGLTNAYDRAIAEKNRKALFDIYKKVYLIDEDNDKIVGIGFEQ
ncbi:MAG: hypothetical protein HKN25_11120 [Pyrinomonadaceae bacterium]|nr:hypothetical protein [Pyrinomonadaceae bacterium]